MGRPPPAGVAALGLMVVGVRVQTGSAVPSDSAPGRAGDCLRRCLSDGCAAVDSSRATTGQQGYVAVRGWH